jgi:hypothetical protein
MPHTVVVDDERPSFARLAVQRKQHRVLRRTTDGKTIDGDELVSDLHTSDGNLFRDRARISLIRDHEDKNFCTLVRAWIPGR